MLRRSLNSALVLLVSAALTVLSVGTADAKPSNPDAGPPYQYVTALMGQFDLVPLNGSSMVIKTKHGYRFRSGRQDNHLVVTRVEGGIRFADTGSKAMKKLPTACHRQKVQKGVAAVCRVPGGISVRWPLLVEVWPNLGDDFTDTSKLPATFAATVLGDEGNDVARFGAGPDFFNGHSGRDLVWGGGSNDWIRPGSGNDVVHAGEGNDAIVAMEGNDVIYGGNGKDRIGGGEGSDLMWGEGGSDFFLCGTGHDRVNVDRTDRIFHDCESIGRP